MNDPRHPERACPKDFLGAISSAAAIQIVQDFGYPELMDLDHDLGGNDTAMDFVK